MSFDNRTRLRLERSDVLCRRLVRRRVAFMPCLLGRLLWHALLIDHGWRERSRMAPRQRLKDGFMAVGSE